MSLTHVRTSGAIATVLFFFALVFSGCSPNLERRAGSLEVLVRGVPAGADSLEASIDTFTLRAPVAEGRIFFESVPEGTAPVVVRAFSGTREVAERTVEAQIVAAATTSITVDLMSVPVDSVRCDPTTTTGRARGEDVGGGSVAARFEALNIGAAAACKQRADAQLGGGYSIRVETIAVTMTDQEMVSTLSQVFSGEVRATLIGGTSMTAAEVASGTFAASLTGRLEGLSDQSALAAIAAEFLAGNASLVLTGPTPQPAGGDFRADLSAQITIVAFRP